MACPTEVLDKEGIPFIEVKDRSELELINYSRALAESSQGEVKVVWFKNPQSLNTFLVYLFCDGKWIKFVLPENKVGLIEELKASEA